MVRSNKQVVPYGIRTGNRSPNNPGASRDRAIQFWRQNQILPSKNHIRRAHPLITDARKAIEAGGQLSRKLFGQFTGRSTVAANNYKSSNAISERGEGEPPAKKPTTTIERASTDSEVAPYRGEDSNSIMSSQSNEEPVEEIANDEQQAPGAGRGGGGGMSGGGAGGATGGNGMMPAVLAVINPHNYLTATKHYSSKRFNFLLRNRNWKTGAYTDPQGTVFVGRQLPYYWFNWYSLFWYLDISEFKQILQRTRYSKITNVIFEITFKSHTQTFTTQLTETAVAGNGNVSQINLFRDQNGKYPFTMFNSNTVVGNDLGTLDNRDHQTFVDKLYGQPIIQGQNNINAGDGPRNYTHVPTYLVDASVPMTHPSFWITGLNTFASKCADFTTMDRGASYLIQHHPKNGLIGVGPSAAAGKQNDGSGTTPTEDTRYRYFNHADNVWEYGMGSHTGEGFNQAPVANSSGNYLRQYDGYYTNPDSMAHDAFMEMFQNWCVENYFMKPTSGQWPTSNLDPLFYGVEPRQFDEGAFITGFSNVEVNTAIEWSDQEAHPLTVNYPATQAASNWNSFQQIHNFGFNDTGSFLGLGYSKVDQYGFRGQQVFDRPVVRGQATII